MNAVEGFDAAFQEITRDGAIGGQHEFLDQAVGDVALAARDVGHALLFVELDDRLGEIEIDGAVLGAASVEQQCEFFHVAEVAGERGVALGHFRIAFDNLVHVGVGHALGGADDAGSHARGFHVAGGVEFHERAHDQAVFAGF